MYDLVKVPPSAAPVFPKKCFAFSAIYFATPSLLLSSGFFAIYFSKKAGSILSRTYFSTSSKVDLNRLAPSLGSVLNLPSGAAIAK